MTYVERRLAERIEVLVASLCGTALAVEIVPSVSGAAFARVPLEPYARWLTGYGRTSVDALVALWLDVRTLAHAPERLRVDRPTVPPSPT